MCNRHLWNWSSLNARISCWYANKYTVSHVSLPPEVREMTLFGRGEPASPAPEECWLLLNHLKPSYTPGWAHVWIFGLPLRVLTRTSSDLLSKSLLTLCHVYCSSNLFIPRHLPCAASVAILDLRTSISRETEGVGTTCLWDSPPTESLD